MVFHDQSHARDYAWIGKYVQSHQIGEYIFVEYLQKDPITKEITEQHMFGIHSINGMQTNQSCHSLDEALLYALGRKYLGQNTQFGHFASVMLGIRCVNE